MACDPLPKCPKCENRTVKLVSQKHRWSEKSRTRPLSTLSVYGCPCGTGFTHLVQHDIDEKVPATE